MGVETPEMWTERTYGNRAIMMTPDGREEGRSVPRVVISGTMCRAMTCSASVGSLSSSCAKVSHPGADPAGVTRKVTVEKRWERARRSQAQLTREQAVREGRSDCRKSMMWSMSSLGKSGKC